MQHRGCKSTTNCSAANGENSSGQDQTALRKSKIPTAPSPSRHQGSSLITSDRPLSKITQKKKATEAKQTNKYQKLAISAAKGEHWRRRRPCGSAALWGAPGPRAALGAGQMYSSAGGPRSVLVSAARPARTSTPLPSPCRPTFTRPWPALGRPPAARLAVAGEKKRFLKVGALGGGKGEGREPGLWRGINGTLKIGGGCAVPGVRRRVAASNSEKGVGQPEQAQAPARLRDGRPL